MDLGPLGTWAAVAIALGTLIYAIVGNRAKKLAAKINGAFDRIATAFERIDELETRATKIESALLHLPDKDSTHRIEMGMQELRGGFNALAAELRGQMDVLTERVEPIAKISDRLQEFLLEQAERGA